MLSPVGTPVNILIVIYTVTNWWTTCTGNSTAFASNSLEWIARYSSGWAETIENSKDGMHKC
ncbi:hypothetical protein BDQ17DRAFT_1347732 [Cyathus striatus]|nr:hypothetical protein BDQ17DRAFT_1347732 [Cyathus striatus]